MSALKSLRIVVLSRTGNVGKTMTATNMLKTNLPEAEFVAVETVNETAGDLGVEVTKLAGSRFKEIHAIALREKLVIVDVGAGNTPGFIDGLARYQDSHQDFDWFLLPVTNGTKDQKEAISLFLTLRALGVPAEKIKIVFNRVESDVEAEFSVLFKYARVNPEILLDPRAAIMENELFDMMGQKQTSMKAVLDDPVDYRANLDKIDPQKESKLFRQTSEAYQMRQLAKTVRGNLDQVYRTLFGGAQ